MLLIISGSVTFLENSEMPAVPPSNSTRFAPAFYASMAEAELGEAKINIFVFRGRAFI
jgi:hypothetical protein